MPVESFTSGNTLYFIITGICMVLSRLAGSMLQKKFAKYSASRIDMSGAEVAVKMLRDFGINDVKVISVAGQLTDHYNPMKKTVNLSEVVYNQRNVSAAAVAAHECGHAVQHAKSYGALKMRSALVPLVNISSKFMPWVLMGGLVLAAGGNTILLLVGVIMFASTTLFSLVTLPVEFDASRRALKWLDSSRIVEGAYESQAKEALKWAASTYVVAAIASIGQLLFYVLRLMAARR